MILAHSQIRDIHIASKELCKLSQRNENVNSILMCTTSNPVSEEKQYCQEIEYLAVEVHELFELQA